MKTEMVKLNEKKVRSDLERAGWSLAKMSKALGYADTYLNQRFSRYGTMPKGKFLYMYRLLGENTESTVKPMQKPKTTAQPRAVDQLKDLIIRIGAETVIDICEMTLEAL